MGKIIVIYHSQQYGNTKMLAEALAEGAREAGAEVNLINTNERRVTLEEFLSADGVAIGTPDYFSYVAGTVKTFFDDMYLWDQSGKPVKGKPAALFLWWWRESEAAFRIPCSALFPAGGGDGRK